MYKPLQLDNTFLGQGCALHEHPKPELRCASEVARACEARDRGDGEIGPRLGVVVRDRQRDGPKTLGRSMVQRARLGGVAASLRALRLEGVDFSLLETWI